MACDRPGRVQAPDIPSFLTRKMVKDLTPFFRDSRLIKIDDLADANKNYWFEGFTPGRGKIYGITKDCSLVCQSASRRHHPVAA